MTDISLSTVLKACGFGLAASLFLLNIKILGRREREVQRRKKEEFKDFSYLRNMQKDEEIYVKAKLENSQINKINKIFQKRPIHYNEFYLQQPSDMRVIQDLFHSQKYGGNQLNKKQWKFVDQKSWKAQFYGIEKIVGDVYQIDRKYEDYEVGTLKRFWGGICYYFQCIFDAVRKKGYEDYTTTHISITREPLIKGPVVGLLHYAVGILTDVYFVLKIRFDGEFHEAVVLAESRYALIKDCQFDVASAKLGLLFFGAVTGLLGYLLYKDLKKSSLIQGIIYRIERARDKKWLQVEDVGEEKACIICYSSCRNLILFDCKHLIMCWGCWKTMKDEDCPVCKNKITTARLIYSDEQIRDHQEVQLADG